MKDAGFISKFCLSRYIHYKNRKKFRKIDRSKFDSAPLIILLLIIVKFVALFGSFGSIKRKK